MFIFRFVQTVINILLHWKNYYKCLLRKYVFLLLKVSPVYLTVEKCLSFSPTSPKTWSNNNYDYKTNKIDVTECVSLSEAVYFRDFYV